MKIALVGTWVYARNRQTGVTARIWPDEWPEGPRPRHIKLSGAFCPYLVELRALRDALRAEGLDVVLVDHMGDDIATEHVRTISSIPSVVVVQGGEMCRVYRVDDAADLDPANFSAAQFQQDVTDHQAERAAAQQAEEDDATESHNHGATARAILAKIEDDTITTSEMKQVLGVLIKRELRRSRKERS
ncbi:MAG: hypothetical protein ACYTGX_17905 [Planctomycetota bacterium]|jgi:hypothetical protein